MSQRHARISWAVLLLGVIAVGICLSMGQAQDEASTEATKTVAPERLLPAETVLYVHRDESSAHEEAWKQTAAYESMYATGVADLVEKFTRLLAQRVTGETDPRLHRFAQHVTEQGFSLAVSMPSRERAPIPQVTLVLHQAADHETAVADFLKSVTGPRVQFSKRTVASRTVTSGILPRTPGVEIGWWAEGGHLVLVAGIDAVGSIVPVAAGEAPNVTSNQFWKQTSQADAEFETVTTGWLDVAALRNRLGAIPLPVQSETPVTVARVLETLGLDALDAVVYRSGYKGRSLVCTTDLQTHGELKGLLSIADQKPMTFDDLPPLPAGTIGFYATRLDLSKLYDDLTQLAGDVAALRSPQAKQRVQSHIQSWPEILGFDPETQLIDALGDVLCVYADPDQGFLGSGSGLVVQVRDAEALRATMNKAFERLGQIGEEDFRVHDIRKHGREVMTFEFGRRVHLGALTVDDDWLVLGFLPQTVDAFLLRADGKLDRWSPQQLRQAGVTDLPDTFTSIAVNDPRASYRAAMKLAPLALTSGVSALKVNRVLPPEAELPITAADVPPAEQVVAPLFPNVRTAARTEEGVRWTSHNSLPSIPLVSGIGSGSTVVTSSVLVALLLPAVQQAREAARRTQSRNNLKQLGLAMHNYHDVNKSFPPGTYPNEKLKPDERLSWISMLLPYLDQARLYENIDFEGGWKDKANEKSVETRLGILTNPGVATPTEATEKAKYGPTHYVGIAGLGKDAPLLPADHKRAGVFGYNRRTQIQDIRDGTSNTVMISEAGKDFGPWAAGGKTTIRALTKKPYINGPDGIGGPYRGGCNVLFADGSVRFLSENIDPTVFEALVTINGGEVVNIK